MPLLAREKWKITASALALSLMLSAAGNASVAQQEPVAELPEGKEASSNYLAARFAVNEHDLSEAARRYRISSDKDPNNTSLLSLAFFYSASAGEMSKAFPLAEKVAKAAPRDRVARIALAVAALKKGDYDETRKEAALSGDGTAQTLTVLLIDAWAAAGQKDKAAAAENLQKIKMQPGADVLSAFQQGLLMDYLGDSDAADQGYRAALTVGGPNARIIDAYGRFLERNGRGKDAELLYTSFASEQSSIYSTVAALGLERLKKGRKPDPLIESPQAGLAEAFFGIASSLTEATNLDISVLYLRFALYLEPDHVLASITLADRFEKFEKFDDALGIYRAVEKSSPYWRIATIEAALANVRLSKSDEAIAELNSLTNADPADKEAWTALGDTYRESEHYEQAAEAYGKAIATLGTPAKKDWTLYYVRGISYERVKQWDKAEADLQTALKLSPDEPQVLNYLGYSWVEQGKNITDALAMLEKARKLRPFDGYIVDSVGWAYFRLGRYDEAARMLEDAITLVPADPTINDHLGDAYWRTGRKIEARFQWNHALAFGPEEKDKALIEAKIKTGLKPGDKPT